MTASPRAPGHWVDELPRDSAFARLWLGFMTARITIAAGLLVLLGGLIKLVPALRIEGWLVLTCAAYLGATIAGRAFMRPLPPGRTFDPQWVTTIGVDLVAFTTLHHLQAAGINYSPLFAFPVLMAALLGSRALALGTAAGVTLLLLAHVWLVAAPKVGDVAAVSLQAGLTGAAYMAFAFIVNQLAARLAREEQAALAGRRAAQMHAQVNELVIEGLSEGVVVADAHADVHAANPAARALLGLEPEHKAAFDLTKSSWEPLRQIAAETFEYGQGFLRQITLEDEAGRARHIHVRTRLTAARDPDTAGLCVMFLQDLRELEARLRIEKLAAMGRMSAAVAHEIRNPLAAIAQATGLLDEDLKDPALRQLNGLVRKNTQRLAQIVEDVLDVSRARHGAPYAAPPLSLDAAVQSTCSDWAAQTRNGARLQCILDAPVTQVRFAPDHLRRVLVNLLDNAARYAGDLPDSIHVSTRTGGPHASLHVWSDGTLLDPAVEEHLFEPFFSSESRSSGLGLYICRELCERNGAAIGYRRSVGGAAPHQREGNDFVVTFALNAPLAAPSSFDTIGA